MSITIPASVMMIAGASVPPAPSVSERLSLITTDGKSAVTFTLANYTVIYCADETFWHHGYHVAFNLNAVVARGSWFRHPLTIDDLFVKGWDKGEPIQSMVGITVAGKEHYCTSATPRITGTDMASYLADQFEQVSATTVSIYTSARALVFPEETVSKIYGSKRFQMATNSQGSLLLSSYGGIRRNEVAVLYGVGYRKFLNIINPSLRALFMSFGDERVEIRWTNEPGKTQSSAMLVRSAGIPGMTVLIPFISK